MGRAFFAMRLAKRCFRDLDGARAHGRRAGGGGFGQNPMMNGEKRKFKAVGDADLVVNIAQIIFHHLLGSPKKGGDLFVFEALYDEGDNLQLLGCKAVTYTGADEIIGLRVASLGAQILYVSSRRR